MRYVNPKRYQGGGQTGAAVGTAAGAALGSVIPGVGTALGATLGGAAGKLIGGLFGRKKKKKPKPPPTIGRTFQASYGFKTGGDIPGVAMRMGGRSHEAGGVNLAEFGRPDVEVERNEVVTFDEQGSPQYVYSAMKMNDSPRTFAEEYERLVENEDLEGIKKLQMKQEEQMGRKNDVTVDDTMRQAQFAKGGGNLKFERPSGSGYNTRRSIKKYGGRFNKRTGGNMYHNVKRMQTGGPPSFFNRMNANMLGQNDFRFYNYPGVASSVSPDPINGGSLPGIDVTAPGNSMYNYNIPAVNLSTGEVPQAELSAVDVPEAPAITGEAVASAGDVATASGAEAAAPSGIHPALDIAGKVLPYAADLFNIGVASRMKKPKRPRNITPVLADTRVSTTAEEEAISAQARSIIGDPTASAAQKLAANAQLQRATNQIRSSANRRSDQIRMANADLINRTRAQNQAAQERYQDRVDQFQGAKLSAISGGVRSIADRVERQAAGARQQELMPLQLTAILHSMPTSDRQAYIRDLMNSLPAGHWMRSYLQGMSGGVAA